jgi:hypothetical protein
VKINVNLGALQNLQREMGAPTVEWTIKWVPKALAPLPPIEVEGIEVSLDDVKVSLEGYLEYQHERVLLYIKDTRQTIEQLQDSKKAKKFHIADCRTLERMRKEKRFDRYIVTQRRDGKFQVDVYNEFKSPIGEREMELPICIICLCL